MGKLAQEKHSPWRVWEQCQNSEGLFQTPLLIFLVTLPRRRVTPGKSVISEHIETILSTHMPKNPRTQNIWNKHLKNKFPPDETDESLAQWNFSQIKFITRIRLIIYDVHSSDFVYIFNVHRFLVRVSYLEIYNEEVRDLLGKDQMQRLEVTRYLNLRQKRIQWLITELSWKIRHKGHHSHFSIQTDSRWLKRCAWTVWCWSQFAMVKFYISIKGERKTRCWRVYQRPLWLRRE